MWAAAGRRAVSIFTKDEKLMFPKEVERALAMEAARKNVAKTRVVESMATQLRRIEGQGNDDFTELYGTQGITGKQLLVCYCCGCASHTLSVHPHINNTCSKCGKKGLIQGPGTATGYMVVGVTKNREGKRWKG